MRNQRPLTTVTDNLPLQALTIEYQQRVEKMLEHWLPDTHTLPENLHAAMRYSVLNGGKRVRAILVYMVGNALDIKLDALDGAACAVEIIHAYSLIHDDLPAMDDDDLRRGKPTCHRQYDEATAILAGDALHSLAFHILAHDPTIESSDHKRLKMVECLAQAIGSRGMAGGQAIDLASEGKTLTLAELENMHIHKTGALIRASIELATLSGDCPTSHQKALDKYAKCIGLSFQIRDDILDIEADTDTLGKPQGADIARNKSTYPSLLGLSEAKRWANELHQDAVQAIDIIGKSAEPLSWLSRYIIERGH